jgi:transposase InsO family protein
MSLQGNLSVERTCYLAQVSRSGFYRWLSEEAPDEEEMELRDKIQKLFIKHRRKYGYRRIAQELRREGMFVNGKRVLRLMREDNLLAVQAGAFVPTTNSNHDFRVYLNLAGRMKLTGINQLWVADLTYIRLKGEFVYLAVILDAFSRKVVGWALDRTLKAELTIAALNKAIESRKPLPGLVHHSDRGVQYAAEPYVRILRQHGIESSMSRPANPYDNAFCESFIKTLKQEEVYANQYRNIDHLRTNLEEFIDRYYNPIRLHSALGYRSPTEFESISNDASLGATMSFFRHREPFELMNKRKPPEGGFPDHQFDESPTGYSLAGWSPPEPTSASPVDCDSNQSEISVKVQTTNPASVPRVAVPG